MATEPYTIVVTGKFSVHLAAVGAAFPELNATPDATVWPKLCDGGRIDEDGLTIEHGQTIDEHMVSGLIGPAKISRSGQTLAINFTCVDLTMEQYAKVLNGQTVTDTAKESGKVGHRSIALALGEDVKLYAMLVRFETSPYGAGYKMQYEIPQAYQGSSPSVVFSKSEKAGLECSFMALEHATSGFGTLRMQDDEEG